VSGTQGKHNFLASGHREIANCRCPRYQGIMGFTVMIKLPVSRTPVNPKLPLSGMSGIKNPGIQDPRKRNFPVSEMPGKHNFLVSRMPENHELQVSQTLANTDKFTARKFPSVQNTGEMQFSGVRDTGKSWIAGIPDTGKLFLDSSPLFSNFRPLLQLIKQQPTKKGKIYYVLYKYIWFMFLKNV